LETSLQRKPWHAPTWIVETRIDKYAQDIQSRHYIFALIWLSGKFSSTLTIALWDWSFGRECSGLFLIIIKTAELLASC
jgi:hypothetical protein